MSQKSVQAGRRPIYANDSSVPRKPLIYIYVMSEPMKEEMDASLACPPPNDRKSPGTWKAHGKDSGIHLRDGNTFHVFVFLHLNTSESYRE